MAEDINKTCSTFLLRFSSDMVTKSPKVRARFARQLLNNLKLIYHRYHADLGVEKSASSLQVKAEWSRIFVTGDTQALYKILPRLFGLSSFSRIEKTTSDTLETIVVTGTELFCELVRGKSFAVKAKRTGSQNYRSGDLERQLGAQLRPFAAKVQLVNPEVTVQVEVRPGVAYFCADQVAGAGGLAVGVSGRALCLLSGGYDSVVAAWMMMKRGLCLDYLVCNLAGAAFEKSVLQIAKKLYDDWGVREGGRPPKVHVIDFKPCVQDIRAHVNPGHAQVILKRLFYDAAAAVAANIKAEAVITGECIGQVSSQTIQNLRAIEEGFSLPVLRPVVGFDKHEIIDLCRQTGCFELSEKVAEHCQLVKDRPVTATTAKALRVQAEGLNLEYFEAQIKLRRQIDLRSLSNAALVADYLFIDELPADVVVISIDQEWESRTLEESATFLHLDLHALQTQLPHMSKVPTYVLFCKHRQQSALGAEMMQKAGFTAYSWRGRDPLTAHLKREARL